MVMAIIVMMTMIMMMMMSTFQLRRAYSVGESGRSTFKRRTDSMRVPSLTSGKEPVRPNPISQVNVDTNVKNANNKKPRRNEQTNGFNCVPLSLNLIRSRGAIELEPKLTLMSSQEILNE